MIFIFIRLRRGWTRPIQVLEVGVAAAALGALVGYAQSGPGGAAFAAVVVGGAFSWIHWIFDKRAPPAPEVRLDASADVPATLQDRIQARTVSGALWGFIAGLIGMVALGIAGRMGSLLWWCALVVWIVCEVAMIAVVLYWRRQARAVE